MTVTECGCLLMRAAAAGCHCTTEQGRRLRAVRCRAAAAQQDSRRIRCNTEAATEQQHSSPWWDRFDFDTLGEEKFITCMRSLPIQLTAPLTFGFFLIHVFIKT